MFGRKKTTGADATQVEFDPDVQRTASDQYVDPLADIPKSRWDRLWPVMACGAGLFSDGYINNV